VCWPATACCRGWRRTPRATVATSSGRGAGQLGDGRAITLGEVVGRDDDGEATWELQLKGAGPTPYSRRADGRAVLRSSCASWCAVRRCIPGRADTRARCRWSGPASRWRAICCTTAIPPTSPVRWCGRVAPSFLRFGSYEIHSAAAITTPLRKLVRFTLGRYYPRYVDGDRLDIAGWFAEVAQRTAWLVSEWLRVGFVHGVMNTDNMSILGLTIDYGPYGWIEPFDPDWDAQHHRCLGQALPVR